MIRRAGVLAALTMVLAVLGSSSADAQPPGPSNWSVYVGSRNETLSSFNTATNPNNPQIVPGSYNTPVPMVIAPHLNDLYMGIEGDTYDCGSTQNLSYLLSVNIPANQQSTSTPVAGGRVGCLSALTLSADGGQAYAVWSGEAVFPIDMAPPTPTVGANFQTEQNCTQNCTLEVYDVALSPDGSKLYVLQTINPGGGANLVEVQVINTADNSMGPTITLGSVATYMGGIALSADGQRAYVTTESCFISCLTERLLWTIPLGDPANLPTVLQANQYAWSLSLASAGYLAISPDNTKIYVSEGQSVGGGQSIGAIHLDSSGTPASEHDIEIDHYTYAPLAFTPDGSTVYAVLPHQDALAVLDVATETREQLLPFDEASGLAITPDQAAIAELGITPAPTGQPTTFDASETDAFCDNIACSPVAQYRFDFGDGSPPVTTAADRVQHTYATPGQFTATVTTTTAAGTSTEPIYNGHMLLRAGRPTAAATRTVYIVDDPVLSSAPSGDVRLGGAMHDDVTISGGAAPTGDLFVNVYGPDDRDCTAAPVASTNRGVNGNATYHSDPFTPTERGTYRWTVTYSGDANNATEQLPCGSAGHTVVVREVPTLSGTVPASLTLGDTMRDSATLLDGAQPRGSLVYRAYGPDDPLCARQPVFTTTAVVDHGNATYQSGPFRPSAVGTYRWTVSYSGDHDNEPLRLDCNRIGQRTDVIQQSPPMPPPPPETAAVIPAVGLVLPNTGPTAGGGIVEVFGDGFADGATVMFGDVPSPSVTVDRFNHLAAIAPPHVAGTVGVYVITRAGASELTRVADYTYADPPTSSSGSGASIPPIPPPGCTVPRLTGLTAVAAERRIRAAGCGVGTRRTRVSRQRPGHVLAQSPRAGAKVAMGRKVSFTLSRVARRHDDGKRRGIG